MSLYFSFKTEIILLSPLGQALGILAPQPSRAAQYAEILASKAASPQPPAPPDLMDG